MSQYRWEFGFDWNATPDWAKVNAPNDPTDGAPIALLQNGLYRTVGDEGAAWPSRMETSDVFEFCFYDLTAAQGGTQQDLRVEGYFSIVNPQEGDVPRGEPATLRPFGLPDGTPLRVESVGTSNPAVWTGGSLPAWEFQAQVGNTWVNQFTIQDNLPSPYFTLSVLLKVSEVSSGGFKWFGLDPEVWVLDG